MTRRFRYASLALFAFIGVGFLERGAALTGSPNFCAAYFEPAGRVSLKLFPAEGDDETVPLPAHIPADFYPVGFDSVGRAIYGESLAPGNSVGIWVLTFTPPHLDVVSGSVGLTRIWHLTASPAGRLFVSGPSRNSRTGECGAFGIDPKSGTFEILRQGRAPDCGGGAGPISPDGKRALTYAGKKLAVIELKTGTLQTIKGVDPGMISSGGTWVSACEWSPDGRWIACIRNGRIVLVGGDDFANRKNLGTAGNGPLRWSPDSRKILLSRSQFVCGLGYGGSLEVIEVETGRRSTIASSRCKIGSGVFGWIDENSLR